MTDVENISVPRRMVVIHCCNFVFKLYIICIAGRHTFVCLYKNHTNTGSMLQQKFSTVISMCKIGDCHNVVKKVRFIFKLVNSAIGLQYDSTSFGCGLLSPPPHPKMNFDLPSVHNVCHIYPKY